MVGVHPLKQIISSRKEGVYRGICSICSANEYVIEAAMERSLQLGTYVLIEATANQVNQFGGYTGMKPADFRDFVFSIAKRMNFPVDKIILGGDHLGPLVWKDESSELALEKASELVRQYVLGGFSKIHLDTSMHLGDDDKSTQLDRELIAKRGAGLCAASEEAFKKLKQKNPDVLEPVYVVGSEVPIPGGIQDEEDIQITRVEDFIETTETFKEAFSVHGLSCTWQNVIAVVVQPGVEFGDETIHEYNREAARDLCNALKNYPHLVFEGHSTDYQTASHLREMVEDGIAVLKVGPALTFALREGLFALNYIENEIFKFNPDIRLSNFISVLDDVMAKNPEYWKKHYHGNGYKVRLARKYSLSDRCRYYLPLKEVRESIGLLIKNLESVEIPMTLISEFLPVQYNKIRNGTLKREPEALLRDKIINCIDNYVYAVATESLPDVYFCNSVR